MARIIALKIWPENFEAQNAGKKNHEVRNNDRGYAVGDYLLLQEWSPEAVAYTGRSLAVQVEAVKPIMEDSVYLKTSPAQQAKDEKIYWNTECGCVHVLEDDAGNIKRTHIIGCGTHPLPLRDGST